MYNNLEVKAVVLLDNKSTMDLSRNPYLVEDVKKGKGTFEDTE